MRADLADSLDGGDVVTGRIEREQHAGIHREPVHQHRARTALPQVARLLRTREAEVFAQCQKQRALMRQSKTMGLTVDAQLDIGVRRFMMLTRTGDRSIGIRLEHSQLTPHADECRRPDDDTRARLDERAARRIARVGCIFEPGRQVRRRIFPVAHRSFRGCQRAAS